MAKGRYNDQGSTDREVGSVLWPKLTLAIAAFKVAKSLASFTRPPMTISCCLLNDIYRVEKNTGVRIRSIFTITNDSFTISSAVVSL